MRSVVERIKETLSITDVLSSYITLTPAGSQLKAKCPFHNERTASFYVTPDKGFYYCFGCGAKGDIFTFIEQFEGVDFNGALKLLADRAGIALTRDSLRQDPLTPLYDVLEEACGIYESALKKNQLALQYLTDRGVTLETIEKFRIGYAPDSWEFIAGHFKGAKETLADQAGLLKKGERGNYDRFRSRIMFPIMDVSARVVGFSGRIFPDAPDAPKYLNSPETELFQKSKLLFGFDKAKFNMKRRNFAILVEGQFDLVLSHQAGFTNTIATSGTALSDEGADASAGLGSVAKLTRNIILAFDGDAAGKKAMDRAARLALQLGMNPRVVLVPNGNDPADFIRTEGQGGWKELLKQSEHVVVFQVKDLLAQNLSPHRFAASIRERVFPFIKLIPSAIERSRQLELVSTTAGITLSAIAADFEQFLSDTPRSESLRHGAVSQPQTEAAKQKIDSAALFLGILSWQSSLAEPMIDVLGYRDRAGAINFEEHQYVLPDLDDDALHRSRTYAAATYSGMDKGELEDIVDELLAGIAYGFLEMLRGKYTTELTAAEREENEESIGRLLPLLHRLSSRLHDLKMIDK